jgi:hypothetical protein
MIDCLVNEVKGMEEFKVPTAVNKHVLEHSNIILALDVDEKTILEGFLSKIQHYYSEFILYYCNWMSEQVGEIALSLGKFC